MLSATTTADPIPKGGTSMPVLADSCYLWKGGYGCSRRYHPCPCVSDSSSGVYSLIKLTPYLSFPFNSFCHIKMFLLLLYILIIDSNFFLFLQLVSFNHFTLIKLLNFNWFIIFETQSSTLLKSGTTWAFVFMCVCLWSSFVLVLLLFHFPWLWLS